MHRPAALSLTILLGAIPARAEEPARIVATSVEGTLLDARPHLDAVISGVAPPGAPFVESGPADRMGAPIGTIPRVAETLAALGYDAVIEARPESAGVRLVIHLRPFDRVRQIFVTGNWPLRQDEIQRRISVRPGQPLLLPGPGREAALERDRQRLVEYLHGEGYLEANARIDVRQAAVEGGGPVDLLIAVSLGPAFPIGPIRVEGNTVVSSEDVAAAFRHTDWNFIRSRFRKGAPFDRRRLRDDASTIVERYHEEGYPGVRVTPEFSPESGIDHEKKHVLLGVRVAEHRRVVVDFEGNKRSARDLREALTIFERGAADDFELDASAGALHRYYQERGHFFARVSWRRERDRTDADHVVFTIDEGPVLKVRSVTFVGNAEVASKTLGEVVSVRTYPFLGLGAGGYVTGRQVEADAERLVEYYRALGWADAQAQGEIATNSTLLGLPGALAATAGTTDRDADGLVVRYTVREGPRLHVGGVRFRSADGAPLPEDARLLLKNLRLRPGVPLRPALIKEDAGRLQRVLGDDGYPAATAEPDVERVGDKATITWKLDPGPRPQLGPILIRGNFLTRPDTILEQIPLTSGRPITTTGFERGQRNLQLLQLFNSVRLSFPGLADRRAVVPLLVEVEERHDHAGIIRLGFGISTEQKAPDSSIPFGAFGRADYEHRNLFGRGWNFVTQTAYGNSLARANTVFQDRRFWGTFFRLEVTGDYLSQSTARLGNIRSWGGSLGFAREMAPGVDAALRYSLRNTIRTEGCLCGAGSDESLDTVQLGTPVGAVSAHLEWLRLDNRFIPSRGFQVDGSVALALPELSFGLGQDTFVKVGAHSLVVMPIASWLTIRHGVRYDQGFPLAGASLLPKVERYFAGGDTTVRGFELDRARAEVTRYPIVPGLDQVSYRPLGGSLRILHNVDLEIPYSAPFFWGFFLDTGVVADSFDGLEAQDFRHGAGLTFLSWKLPVGDIQLGWGWPLDPGPGDTRIGRFHVNIGLMF